MKKEIRFYPPALSPLAPSPSYALGGLEPRRAILLHMRRWTQGERAWQELWAVPSGPRCAVYSTWHCSSTYLQRSLRRPISKRQETYFSFLKPVLKVSVFFSDLQAMFHRNSKIATLPITLIRLSFGSTI